jgi:hypothetical protein
MSIFTKFRHNRFLTPLRPDTFTSADTFTSDTFTSLTPLRPPGPDTFILCYLLPPYLRARFSA